VGEQGGSEKVNEDLGQGGGVGHAAEEAKTPIFDPDRE